MLYDPNNCNHPQAIHGQYVSSLSDVCNHNHSILNEGLNSNSSKNGVTKLSLCANILTQIRGSHGSLWKLLFPGMWCHATWQRVTDVLDESTASIFREEHKGSRFLWNVCNSTRFYGMTSQKMAIFILPQLVN
jgi:hypothetical protein